MTQTHANIFYTCTCTMLWIRKKNCRCNHKMFASPPDISPRTPFCFRELKVVFLFSRERNMCHRVGGIFQIMISDLA